MITDEIFDLLNAATSDTAASRIFMAQPPENYKYVGPYIVMSGRGDQSLESLGGSSGFNTERFEFSCRAKVGDGGNKKCRAMAEEIRMAIQNYKGGTIQNCSQVSRMDLYDYDLNIHVVPVDWEIQYGEPQPA